MATERWEVGAQVDQRLLTGEAAHLKSDSEKGYLITGGEGIVLFLERRGEGRAVHSAPRKIVAGGAITIGGLREAILSNKGPEPLVYCAVPVVRVPSR